MKHNIIVFFLVMAGCAAQVAKQEPAPIVIPPPVIQEPVKQGQKVDLSAIGEVADKSQCSKKSFKDRGTLPSGYYKSLVYAYAAAYCGRASRDDAKAVSVAKRGDAVKDVLTWYAPEFENLGMSNNVAGKDTLRHTYAFLPGLAARESNGRFCAGRDASASFTKSESAEAGTYQTSYGASSSHKSARDMLGIYREGRRHCYLEEAKEGWPKTGKYSYDSYCSPTGWNMKNWGETVDTGYQWQKIIKSCPAFSHDYAAVIVRYNGGSKGEFGPVRRKEVQLFKECDDMLASVEKIVDASPDTCKDL